MKKLFRRFLKGIKYGCGRCHHNYFYHIENETNDDKDCDLCNCKKYSIKRINWLDVLFNNYSKNESK